MSVTHEIAKYRDIVLENIAAQPHKLVENIQWTDRDGDLYMSLRSLVKNNNGVWKSLKQAAFMLKHFISPENGPADEKATLGIDLTSNEKYIILEGQMQWSEHGGRGIRPVGWIFVADDNGIVRQYKLKFKEHVHQYRDNWGNTRNSYNHTIDPEKTTLEWSRPADIDTSHLVRPAEPSTPKGTHVGTPGERLRDIPATVEKVSGPFHGEFGSYYANKLRDENGNSLLYFGKNLGEPGQQIKATFTVGRHERDKHTNEPVTTMKRPIIK